MTQVPPPGPTYPPMSPPDRPRTAAQVMYAIGIVLAVMAATSLVLSLLTSGTDTVDFCSRQDVSMGECLLAGRLFRTTAALQAGAAWVLGAGAIAALVSALILTPRTKR